MLLAQHGVLMKGAPRRDVESRTIIPAEFPLSEGFADA